MSHPNQRLAQVLKLSAVAGLLAAPILAEAKPWRDRHPNAKAATKYLWSQGWEEIRFRRHDPLPAVELLIERCLETPRNDPSVTVEHFDLAVVPTPGHGGFNTESKDYHHYLPGQRPSDNEHFGATAIERSYPIGRSPIYRTVWHGQSLGSGHLVGDTLLVDKAVVLKSFGGDWFKEEGRETGTYHQPLYVYTWAGDFYLLEEFFVGVRVRCGIVDSIRENRAPKEVRRQWPSSGGYVSPSAVLDRLTEEYGTVDWFGWSDIHERDGTGGVAYPRSLVMPLSVHAVVGIKTHEHIQTDWLGVMVAMYGMRRTALPVSFGVLFTGDPAVAPGDYIRASWNTPEQKQLMNANITQIKHAAWVFAKKDRAKRKSAREKNDAEWAAYLRSVERPGVDYGAAVMSGLNSALGTPPTAAPQSSGSLSLTPSSVAQPNQGSPGSSTQSAPGGSFTSLTVTCWESTGTTTPPAAGTVETGHAKPVSRTYMSDEPKPTCAEVLGGVQKGDGGPREVMSVE